MCDTIVALGNSTQDGSVIFGKNSDREPNEAQEIVQIPAAIHSPGEIVRCTYIEIPQVAETFAVLLSKPFWMWGAEMGTNEHGVTIGNEAVFTKTPYGKDPGLIGMDMLRLALERSKNAFGALKIMIDLLERYGQGGNCGFAHKLFYHNSFLICDPEEAWVLETSGKDWAAEKVQNVRSISNAITIDNQWDLSSDTLVSNAVKNGWCKDPSDFSFSRCYSDLIYTTFSDARKRQVCTTQALMQSRGRITPEIMMQALRSHSEQGAGYTPAKGITGADVCCHAGWGPIRGSQTVGSMVSHLKKNEPYLHWLTGTAAPCTSLFRPIWMECGVPEHGHPATGTYDEAVLYWRHEALHREILRDYATRMPAIKPILEETQNQIFDQVHQSKLENLEMRRKVSEECFRAAEQAERKCMEKVRSIKTQKSNDALYSLAWKKFNQEAKLKLD